MLWDNIIEGYAGELGKLHRGQLCELSLKVAEETLSLFDPPFMSYFPPDRLALIKSTLALLRATPPSWQLDSRLGDDFQRSHDALPRVPIRPGVGPFMAALSRLVEGVVGTMDEEVVLEILSGCYESILLSQLSGRVAEEMEASNEACRQELQLQKILITGLIAK